MGIWKWLRTEFILAMETFFMPVIFPWKVLTQGWTPATEYFMRWWDRFFTTCQ